MIFIMITPQHVCILVTLDIKGPSGNGFSHICVCVAGEDTMTGDGGEYLRAEDLRELGDDSLPGQYMDGMNYLRFSLEGSRSERYNTCIIEICINNIKKQSHK